MEVAVPSSPSPLQGQAKVNQNGTSPLPPQPATARTLPNSAVLMTMVTPPGLLSHSIVPGQLYPAPLTSHQDVVASTELFLDTLSKFHTALGTRLAIPKMGGKDLDLHMLYVEVTQRGGLQQVIKERKWKEITGAFDFPRTTTSASYVLRKYYITLLHHYEQVYYFGASGPLIAPPTPLPAPSPVTTRKIDDPPLPYLEAQEEEPEVVSTDRKKSRKRNLVPIQMSTPADPMASIGHVVTGAIESKFDHGYLVTVMVGTEKMRGVIYHIPPGHCGPQHAHVPNYSVTLGAETQLPEKEVKVRKRRPREELKKDPNAPRSNRTGYNFFFAEERAKLKLLHPDKERELSRMIGDAWNNLSEEEKMPYQDQGVKDKERYKKELREYQEQLQSLMAGEGAATLQGGHDEAAAAEAGNATNGDHDYHVATVDSEPEPPLAPVTQHAFNLDQLPYMQHVAAAPAHPPQYPPQQHPLQPYVDGMQINLEGPLYALPPQHLHQGHEIAGPEGYQGAYTQPQPHQFMG